MPTLTTQSIGVLSAQVSGAQASNANARVSEVTQAAGVQLNLNRQQAQASSSQFEQDRRRTIQRDEARTEGAFADRDSPNEGHEGEQATRPPGSSATGTRLNKVA